MRAVVITTNYGVEQSELLSPITAMRDAGFEVVVAAPEKAPIQTLVFDKEPGVVTEPDITLDEVSPEDFDLIVIPGGTINADSIRTDTTAVALIQDFAKKGATVASICHGPWLLVEAGLAEGKTLTSWTSIATDLKNSGATWTDEELVVDEGNGWTLITSRSPHDLDAFNQAIISTAK